MLKKYIAIFLLSISNLILVGHSIIPHCHNEEHIHEVENSSFALASNHEHEHYHHHQVLGKKDVHAQHSDEKSNVLSHLFAHVKHTSEYVNCFDESRYPEHSVQQDQAIPATFSFMDGIVLKASYDNLKIIIYPDPDYFPPPNLSQGLRAPPILFS